jgi:hypothetical protein
VRGRGDSANDDEVGAAAGLEGGHERVTQGVDGGVVLESCGGGDRGDDVVGAPLTLTALVEKQGRVVFGAGTSLLAR